MKNEFSIDFIYRLCYNVHNVKIGSGILISQVALNIRINADLKKPFDKSK